MTSARPLRDVFTDLAGDHATSPDPAAVLAASGHADLPEGLVAEAVVNYADTAPIEVAQHLAPFVMANSAVPVTAVYEETPADWLQAVSTAPVGHEYGTDVDPGYGYDPPQVSGDGPGASHGPHQAYHDPSGHLDLAFGTGEIHTPIPDHHLADPGQTHALGVEPVMVEHDVTPLVADEHGIEGFPHHALDLDPVQLDEPGHEHEHGHDHDPGGLTDFGQHG